MDAQLLILDEVGARLSNLQEDNGYRFSIVPNSIVRAKLTPFKNKDLPAINYYTGADTLDIKTGKRETRSLDLIIEAYTKTRDEPFIDVGIRLGNDIVKALKTGFFLNNEHGLR